MILDWQYIWLTFIFFIPENRTVLEKKHLVCDLESTETVTCSSKDLPQLGQNISWYNDGTGVKIKSEGRIELNGLSFKINRVQLDDAGTYECRGLSSTRLYTIYVNSEFLLRSCCSSLRHYFDYTSQVIKCNVFSRLICFVVMLLLNIC